MAGVAAVVLSTGEFGGEGGEFDHDDDEPGEVAECILAGADDLGARGRDRFYGHGRLNVLGAIRCDEDDDEDDDDDI